MDQTLLDRAVMSFGLYSPEEKRALTDKATATITRYNEGEPVDGADVDVAILTVAALHTCQERVWRDALAEFRQRKGITDTD